MCYYSISKPRFFLSRCFIIVPATAFGLTMDFLLNLDGGTAFSDWLWIVMKEAHIISHFWLSCVSLIKMF